MSKTRKKKNNITNKSKQNQSRNKTNHILFKKYKKFVDKKKKER